MSRAFSELSPHSLSIASLTWFVVVAWAECLNTVINGLSVALGAQKGWQEVLMRFMVAGFLTAGTLAIYKREHLFTQTENPVPENDHKANASSLANVFQKKANFGSA